MVLANYKDLAISIYSDRAALENMLRTKKIDILLFGSDIYDGQVSLGKDTLAVMLYDADEIIPESCMGFKKINKYQKIGTIYQQLMYEYSEYARSRGVSVRKALDDAGFDTRNLPEGTTLVTAKAWDDSVSRASLLGGYNYQKAYYKGVNIDDKNAAEYNVQLVDCGWNFWKNSEWNYMVRGYAAMFWLKK